jgi:hypothetical protein
MPLTINELTDVADVVMGQKLYTNSLMKILGKLASTCKYNCAPDFELTDNYLTTGWRFFPRDALERLEIEECILQKKLRTVEEEILALEAKERALSATQSP